MVKADIGRRGNPRFERGENCPRGSAGRPKKDACTGPDQGSRFFGCDLLGLQGSEVLNQTCHHGLPGVCGGRDSGPDPSLP